MKRRYAESLIRRSFERERTSPRSGEDSRRFDVSTFPRFRTVVLAFALLMCSSKAAAQLLFAQQPRQPEEPLVRERLAVLKAGAVFHIAGHTEWPEERFDDTDEVLAPLVIALVGRDGFGFERYIGDVLEGQRIHGRRLILRRLEFPLPPPEEVDVSEEELERFQTDVREAHLLYIGASEVVGNRYRRTLDAVDGHGVLTISSLSQFAERGGMLGLAVRENRLAIEVNIDLIRNNEIRVSSRLLRLARIVNAGRDAREIGNQGTGSRTKPNHTAKILYLNRYLRIPIRPGRDLTTTLNLAPFVEQCS